MKTARLILTLAVFAILPGCGYLVCGYHNVAGWTSHQWSAEKAWQSRKWIYADMHGGGPSRRASRPGTGLPTAATTRASHRNTATTGQIGGLTETERLNAQAWSDGFTHGTVAAQQDHAVGPMAPRHGHHAAAGRRSRRPLLFAAANVRRPDMGLGGSNQYWQNGPATPPFEQPAMMPGSGYPSPIGQNAPYTPGAEKNQYAPVGNNNSRSSPPPVPAPAPASEAMPAPPSSSPTRGTQLPPPAPASVPTTAAEIFPRG